MEIKKLKTPDPINITHTFSNNTGKIKSTTERKWMRTCLSCNKNFYSREEFTTHMKEAHDKKAAKQTLETSRPVDNSIRNAKLDVPEEVLVKSKLPEKKKDEVATSRRRRKPADKPAETAETTEPEAKVEYKDLVAEAKSLGIKASGKREDLEKSIAEAKEKQ